MASRSVRCPVASTLDLVGDRWTLLIVRDLLKGEARFGDLRRSVEGITPSVLSARLKLLEAEGLVDRRLYRDHPPRAEYFLTAKGHSLGVVVGALASWGERHTDHDLSIVDHRCGHGVDVVYRCPTLATAPPPAPKSASSPPDARGLRYCDSRADRARSRLSASSRASTSSSPRSVGQP